MAIQIPGKAGYVFLSFDAYQNFLNYTLRPPVIAPKDEDSTIGEVVRGAGLPPGIHQYSDFKVISEDSAMPMIFGYELIQGYQCPYWDFDGELSEADFTVLIEMIKMEFENAKICVNLYNSNGKRTTGGVKYSFHVVVKGVFVKGHKECGQLTSKIIKATRSSNLQMVYDSTVYSSKRNLRLLGSRKLDDRRTKVFDRILFVSDGFHSSHSEDPLYMSLVIGTEDAIFHEVEISKTVFDVPNHVIQTECGVRQEHIPMIQELLERDYSGVFIPYKLVNGLLSMNRNIPAHCKLCDRKHDSNGCFITRFHGEFFFNCFQKPNSRLSLTCLDGDDEVEILVVDKKVDFPQTSDGEVCSTTSERIIKTKRGTIPISTYVAKLLKLHRWSEPE